MAEDDFAFTAPPMTVHANLVLGRDQIHHISAEEGIHLLALTPGLIQMVALQLLKRPPHNNCAKFGDKKTVAVGIMPCRMRFRAASRPAKENVGYFTGMKG